MFKKKPVKKPEIKKVEIRSYAMKYACKNCGYT